MRPKKEEYEEAEDEEDEKPIGMKMKQKSNTTKSKPNKQVPLDDKKKGRRKKEEEEEEGKKKRIKKVYDLPGQKRDPPEQRDPLRIFYETLYQQKPSSELAALWMMESGLLPLEEANKVYEKKMKKMKNQRVTSPAKSVKTVKETHSVTVKKRVETSTRISSTKKRTTVSASASKQSKKPKDESSEEDSSSDEESEEEFAPTPQKSAKKAKVEAN
ncbi:hypothetical protein RND81_01G000700 [Saponaria officinalis]|uniref:Uncharacterized protein n=1 Tax=Saponaria officinalis TaxID=3572 RepID=A0AAW1NEX5_SAPOF